MKNFLALTLFTLSLSSAHAYRKLYTDAPVRGEIVVLSAESGTSGSISSTRGEEWASLVTAQVRAVYPDGTYEVVTKSLNPKVKVVKREHLGLMDALFGLCVENGQYCLRQSVKSKELSIPGIIVAIFPNGQVAVKYQINYIDNPDGSEDYLGASVIRMYSIKDLALL